MYAIAMTTWKRPQYYKRVLGSLMKNSLAGFEEIFINVEPGNSEVGQLVNGIDFLKTNVVFNKTVRGLPANPHDVMTRAFSNNSVEFVLYLQDDCYLSPDALSVCRYYMSLRDREQYFSLCLYNPKGKQLPLSLEEMYAHDHFVSLGYGITRRQWDGYIKNAYFLDSRGYDWSLLELSKKIKKQVLSPRLSRCHHIGRLDAVHYRPHLHDQEYLNQPMNWDNGTYEYRVKQESNVKCEDLLSKYDTSSVLKTIARYKIKGILPGTHKERLAKAAMMSNGPAIEIGVLAGLSTCVIGLSLPKVHKIISVDPFKVEYLSDMAKGIIKDVSGSAALSKSSFFESWQKQVSSIPGLLNRLSPVQGDRLEVVSKVKEILGEERAGLLFIDGLHGYEDVKKDIDTYLPLVKNGGIIVFHDYAPGWGVYQAVNEAIAKNQIEIVDNDYQLITRKVGD